MEALLTIAKKIIPSRVADAVRPAYHLILAVVGQAIYRFPGRELKVIGVTGTDGKSTTCNFITTVLEAGGHTVGMVTTLNFKVAGKETPNKTKMTSLGRFALPKLLRQMVKAGCTHAVIEVSSHALTHQRRVWGVPFNTAVFTNLSREHLDYFKTMERYRAAKGRLFAGLKKSSDTTSVVNGDDPAAPYFLNFYADKKYVFGTSSAVSDILPLAHTVVAEDIKNTSAGSTFRMKVDDEAQSVEVKMPGRFNVSNALAAAAVGLTFGVPLAKISKGIAALKGLPGRMEFQEFGQPFAIVIDFTVTPNAYEQVLSTLRKKTTGKLISVFGAAGERDQGKRPLIGEIAGRYSDFTVLTEDDPYSEDPLEIISQIVPGLERAGKTSEDYSIVPNRRTAIKQALEMARPGDTVAILGKGHEQAMSYADRKVPWSDRDVAAEEWHTLA